VIPSDAFIGFIGDHVTAYSQVNDARMQLKIIYLHDYSQLISWHSSPILFMSELTNVSSSFTLAFFLPIYLFHL